MVLALYEMQKASFSILTRVAVYTSFDNNYDTMNVSNRQRKKLTDLYLYQ